MYHYVSATEMVAVVLYKALVQSSHVCETQVIVLLALQAVSEVKATELVSTHLYPGMSSEALQRPV